MDENRIKQVGDRVSNLGKQAEDAGETVASAIGEAARKGRTRAIDLGEQAYEQGAEAGRSFERLVGEHTVASLLVAAALGYGISHLARRH